MTRRISSLACFSAAHVFKCIGEVLLKPSTSCGQRRTHHVLWKPAARNCAPSNFRRTGRASAGVATGCRELSLPVLFIHLFEHV